MKTDAGRSPLLFVCSIVGLLLFGCAPKRVVFTSDPSFPPKAKPPMRVFLAAPIDSMNLSLGRDEMIRYAGDPDLAMEKARCVWDKGLTELTRRTSKNTELVSGILGDPSPYAATGEWIRYTADAISVPEFSVTDPAVLSRLQTDGFDYVVVPQNLSLCSSEGKGADLKTLGALRDELYFETAVAVVDLRKNTIVWAGVVSSYRQNLAVQSTGAMEREAYDWLYDLLTALGRKVGQPRTRFQPCG